MKYLDLLACSASPAGVVRRSQQNLKTSKEGESFREKTKGKNSDHCLRLQKSKAREQFNPKFPVKAQNEMEEKSRLLREQKLLEGESAHQNHSVERPF